jgi:hypothetical protein
VGTESLENLGAGEGEAGIGSAPEIVEVGEPVVGSIYGIIMAALHLHEAYNVVGV